MRIAIYYEYGKKREIGTGHKYRAEAIAKELKKRGHKVELTTDDIVKSGWDVLIIDHIHNKKSIIDRAKSCNIRVILIDGVEENVKEVDLSISAFYNTSAENKGIKYIAFPVASEWNKHNLETKNKCVFVSMGGFDANDYAELVLDALDELSINAIVTKSINHSKDYNAYNRVRVFNETNYYDAMNECNIAITNGGLTLFQSLSYGLPTIAIPQYEHQKWNIDGVKEYCLSAEPNKEDIKEKITTLMNDDYMRRRFSIWSMMQVDGKGVERICDLIEQGELK